MVVAVEERLQMVDMLKCEGGLLVSNHNLVCLEGEG